MNAVRRCLLITLFVSIAACGKDDPPAGDAGAADMRSSTDMATSTDDSVASEDAGGDMGVPPTSDMNGTPDASPVDMATTADMATADMATTDVGGGDGCAAGYTRHDGVAADIIACQGASDALNQCDAAGACGAGWHMCTATDYRAHYEAVEPTAVADGTFWIASCVRSGGVPTAPSDQACTDCTGTQTGGSAEVAFSCVNAISIESDQLFVGVRAGAACTFAGLDAAGNDAYWNAQPSSTLQTGAFCCAD